MRSRNEILSSIFRQGGTGYFESGGTLVEAGELPRHVYRLRTGLAYQSCWFPDGRRAIVDIFAPGNVVGLEMILSLRASGTVTAAGPVKYFAIEADSFYRLMENREIALCFTSLLVEARRRSEELAARIARLESTRARRCDANRPLRQAATTQIVDRALDIQPVSDAAAAVRGDYRV